MNLRARIAILLMLGLAIGDAMNARPGLAAPPSKNSKSAFKREVLPILKKYCVRCHGRKKQESRLRLDTLSIDLVNDRAAGEYWREVLNVLNAGEMPPKDEAQLSTAQRKVLTTWVSGAIQAAIDAQRSSSGRAVLRRLNRLEYQNTMRDLLGLDMDYSRDLPPDPASSDGFRNNGLSLQMSAIQLEYYLQTARRALQRVIVEGPPPKVSNHEFSQSNVKNWLGGAERSNSLGRYQEFLGKMVKDYPETGEFLVKVTLKAELKPNVGFPLMEVAVGYRPDTKILFHEAGVVEITSADEQTLEFRGRIENHPLPVRGQGKYPGLVVRIRNIYDDGSPRQKGKKDKQKGMSFPDEPDLPKILIQKVEFHGPVFDKWPPASHRNLLFDSPLRESDESAYVSEVVQRFMLRAFRRPSTAAGVKRMVEFYESIRPEFPSFEEAIRETLAMVLISPDFLYLVEPAGEAKRSINAWELASRLSYFLWATTPDDELLRLAESEELQKPAVLSAQVERMLKDTRSETFFKQFSNQWLNLNVIEQVAVDRDYYPKFDDSLKLDMRAETQQFFGELVKNNRNALNFLNSDFTMLNESLARHYGIADVYGREFRRVAVTEDQHRGGLLSQAGILLANSTGADSHAVRRAVWIRDRLLNDPPAPPPPDVPSLKEADKKFQKLSIREQLEIHRQTEACGSCHKNIDPWGIALENYDALGLWRDEVRRKQGKKFETLPVVARDVLPDGTELHSAQQLKDYLSEKRRGQFARALVTRLTTYALGRRLELSDQVEIDDLSKAFSKDGYRMRGLVQRIVASSLFQTK